MTLKSMTGFARSEGTLDGFRWHWEIRSVNGRGLDLRLRLPPGYESLEQPARQLTSKQLSRGNCNINLFVKRDPGLVDIKLNEAALSQVGQIIERSKHVIDAAPPSLDGLLSIRGVLEAGEIDETEQALASRMEAILETLKHGIDDVEAARVQEGKSLSKVIQKQLRRITELITELEKSPSRNVDTIQQKLKEQVSRLVEANTEFDDQRLYQEALIIAAKVDIAEEIDRLKVHVKAAGKLLKMKNPVGRKFEFLTQEFNREANTICSKSNGHDITNLGLELKAVIDQIREQVQNIE